MHDYHEHHTHDHSHEDHGSHSGLEETRALLAYMIHHNEHHAEELAALLDSLPTKARKKLLIAIGSFEAANVELQEVLECLE